MGQNTNTFVWHDLNTTDKEGAEAFYSALVGWRFEAHPKGGGYTAMKHGDHDFGGLELARGGAPAHWLGYVDVDDLTERVAKLSKMGAKTLAPEMDIPNVGKIAVVADPSGAAFALYQQLEGANANWAPSRTNPGDFGWAEVVAEDADQAKGFYGEGFGWVAQQTMPTPDGDYHMMFAGEQPIGGLMKRPAQMPVCAWTYFVNVTDAAATLAKATELGATVVQSDIIPDMVHYGVIADPQGAVFGIAQSLSTKS